MSVKLIKEAYNGLNIDPLRQFNKNDYYGYAGAAKINETDEPLIYSGEHLELVVAGGEKYGTSIIEVYTGGDEYGDDVVTYVAYDIPVRKAIMMGKKIALFDKNADSLDDMFEFLDSMPGLREN